MTKKKRMHKEFYEFLLERFQKPEGVASYLQSALAYKDEQVFSLALRDVLKARGETIAGLAEKTQISKQNLYRMLSKRGNLRLASLKTVLHAIGFEMGIRPIKKEVKITLAQIHQSAAR